MKRPISVTTVVLVVAMAAAYQAAKTYDQEVKDTYTTPDGKVVRVVGICSIKPDSVECWGYNRSNAAELAEQVKDRLMSHSGSDMYFRFGKKNRIVVFELSENAGMDFQAVDGVFGSAFYWNQERHPNLKGFRLATEMGAETADVAGTYRTEPATGEVALVAGAKADIGGERYQIGLIQPTKPPKRYDTDNYGLSKEKDAPGSYWKVIVSTQVGQHIGYGVTYGLLDKNRKPIRYVDPKGHPLTSEEYLALGGMPADPSGRLPEPKPQEKGTKPRCMTAEVTMGESISDAYALWINVDPKEIGYLTFSVPKQKTVLFKGIPLDPKN